jgi:hypothetical protein
VHVLWRGAPGERVVALALRAFDERRRAGEGDAVFGVREALFFGGGSGRGLVDRGVVFRTPVLSGGGAGVL